MQKKQLAKEIKKEISELKLMQYKLDEIIKSKHLTFEELCVKQSEINKFEREIFKKVDKLSKE